MNVYGYACSPHQIEPPPQKAGRRARLPTLAVALARQAVGDRTLPASTPVLFGSGYGAATETEAFVENMIVREEDAPMPRAFSASVHNAMASAVAIALGLTGLNRTYVHGELSCWLALRAARGRELALVASLDESTPYIRRGRAVCGLGDGGEGGAVLLVGEGPERPRAVLRFEGDAECWLDPERHHPSHSATLAALATGVLAGELPADLLALASRPASIGIRIVSRFGERARIILDAVP